MKKMNQTGFAAIEALLVLILVAIIGFTSFYVFNAQRNANKTLDSTSKTANSSTAKKSTTATPQAATKYLDIKDWAIKFPYTGTDTLTYKFSSDDHIAIEVISANLAAAYPGCDKLGAGIIVRAKGDEDYPTGGTVAQAYAHYPSAMGKIGMYYYFFYNDEASCANNPTDGAANAQTAANDITKAIVAMAQED